MHIKKIIFLPIIFLFISCNSKISHDFSGETMGTSYSVQVIINKDIFLKVDILKNGVDSLLNEINDKLSTYIEDSEINDFNRHNSTEGFFASDILFELVEKSLYYHEISNGSFDITVGPIVREWGFSTSYNYKVIPDSSVIEKLLTHSGSNKISLKEQYIYKNDPFLEIDLGAIAKGWAVDQIAIYLDSFKIRDYLIEMGGEIFVSGKKSNGKLWGVGIRYPIQNDYNEENKAIFDRVNLSDMAIATSGSYQNYFEYGGDVYSHIINPLNGYPIKQDIISATVISNKCADVDAIATAAMVKGSLIGMEWIDALEETEALFIVKDIHGDYVSITSRGFNDF